MADSFVSKEYLQKQFQNYSTVVKDNFEKKGAVTAETLKYTNVNKPIVDTVKNALDLLFKEGGGGGDSSVTLTQEEYEALTEEEKLNGLYYIYDTKRIYKNGVQYGASEPIPLTMAEYEALKEAGAIDEQQEYLIEADDKGILISAEDIGYNNAKSGIQATTVQGAIDKIAENGGSGEKNVQSDWNETDDTADGFIKNKPTIPDAYDDTALSNRVKAIEDDYAKSSDIPSLSGYATETWVNEQGFLTEHQDLSNYITKDEIPSVPSKVSELTNDSNYQTAEQVNSTVTTEIAKVVADAPEDFDTLKEMSDWIAGHEDDASAMNSAISDNKTAITTLQTDKADKSEIPTALPANGGNSDTVNNHTVEADVPTDAKFTDTLYDDTEVKESITELNSNLGDLAYGERSGNKNLLDVSKIKGMAGLVRCGDYGFNNTTSDTRIESVPFFNLYDGDTFVAGGKSLTKTPSSGIVKAYGTFTTAQSVNRINIGHSGAVKNCTVLFDMNLPVGTYTISMDIVKDNPSIVGGFEFKNIQIEEGDTTTLYKPYIPSVKMLADEVNQQNESLSDYGLNDKKGEILFGYWGSDGTIKTDKTKWVCTQKIPCTKVVRAISKTECVYIQIMYWKADGTYLGFTNDENTKDETRVVKDGTDYVTVSFCYPNDVTSSDFSGYVYTDNDIDVLKNDLCASNAGAHNSVYRGKYLGNALTTEQKAQISAGTFNDLYIGDYWTIDGVSYRIAAFDYWLISGDTKCTEHHVVVVPDTCFYSINMNVTNVTTGAYIGSKMYKTNLEQAKTRINNAFGSANILSHREYLANTTNSTADPSYESAGSWYDSTVELMNEIMVYGANVFHNIEVNGAIPMNYTIDKSQLPLFALGPNKICNRVNWWLRDVVSAACFACVNRNGDAANKSASASLGVRPAFAIKG